MTCNRGGEDPLAAVDISPARVHFDDVPASSVTGARCSSNGNVSTVVIYWLKLKMLKSKELVEVEMYRPWCEDCIRGTANAPAHRARCPDLVMGMPELHSDYGFV